MEQLLYVLSLGFSGSDAARAAMLLLIGALFVTKRFRPWRMTLLLLFIDVVWPYAALTFQGAGAGTLEAALKSPMNIHEDAVVGFLVRAAGFYVILRGTFSLRRRLQETFPEKQQGKAGLMPF
ncbi:MAG: hypothetical protein AAGG79_00760 [Pseudomonadota bacterium]